jgi:hypothetical protein
MLRDQEEHEEQRLADDAAEQRGHEIAGSARAFVIVGAPSHGELVTLEELFDPFVADFIVVVPRKRPGRLRPRSEESRFDRAFLRGSDSRRAVIEVGMIRRLAHVRSARAELDEPVLGVELAADLVQSLTRSLIGLGINGHICVSDHEGRTFAKWRTTE